MSKSDELREALDRAGVGYTCGYRMPDGHRVNVDSVTTAWPVEDDPISSLTFEEEDGELACLDSLTVEQCVVLAGAGR